MAVRIENANDEKKDASDTSCKLKDISPLRQRLRSWLNKNMRIEMTDGRILYGIFLCTDRDRNVILGSCAECLPAESDDSTVEEPRVLGLAMVPGHHIVSIEVEVDSDATTNSEVL
ncbi:N-alpha-acetyltransferase 38, NatC auxiliary subunit [Parasteatoda tepidariorum]|uniref:N-alpha-acetyltransferase 38, NatC auxiliary subunit n=1 Tax=Parasteatoda tepidariorum TaxID=114398 RepID=UPI000A2C05B4|nr:N-alpha-acetyltransferase 38, NatC auxiliary subunit [Parasteatoda tepidariorum]